MKIRVAQAGDAEAACDVLRRSIEELCHRDHGDDPARKREWLANKTPQTFRRWIADPHSRVLVAEIDGQIVGVGAASAMGEIRLNYVAPNARFSGVSKAMLAALEAYLLEQGASTSQLSSTVTARAFYLAAGYREGGEPAVGMQACRPMTKSLG
jgi:predicted GNAT family acetyltransferase